MVNFQPTTRALSVLTLAIATLSTGVNGGFTGTACCTATDSCSYHDGKTPDGYNYEYCYLPGQHKFTQAEADIAKCLVDLHAEKAVKCISTEGSTCNKHSGDKDLIRRAQTGEVPGDKALNGLTANIIQYALDQAVINGLSLTFDDTNWLTVTRTADNGNGSGYPGGEMSFFDKHGNDC
ncbi:MAG: hypothetical protein M1812_006454 [Candelaria pacifica]|nr:MAG: hypothetical protein M1812_006454 [Candelaria pacifica]